MHISQSFLREFALFLQLTSGKIDEIYYPLPPENFIQKYILSK